MIELEVIDLLTEEVTPINPESARAQPDSRSSASPMPTSGNAEAITALPQPAKVSQNVPIASAAYFFVFMTFSLQFGAGNPGKAGQGAPKAGKQFLGELRKQFEPFSA